jgi:hypothetical protein
MKTWGSAGIAPPFLTSAVDGDKWSASRPSLFTHGEQPPVPIVQEAECVPELCLIETLRHKTYEGIDLSTAGGVAPPYPWGRSP